MLLHADVNSANSIRRSVHPYPHLYFAAHVLEAWRTDVKVLIITANDVLARGLMALLDAIADLPSAIPMKDVEAALLVLDQGVVGLVILDGGLPFPAIARLLAARVAAATFPPILLLMDGVDQVELARREQLTPILKGSPTAELILAIGTLLPPSEENPPTNG
jgi:hypothetical protein